MPTEESGRSRGPAASGAMEESGRSHGPAASGAMDESAPAHRAAASGGTDALGATAGQVVTNRLGRRRVWAVVVSVVVIAAVAAGIGFAVAHGSGARRTGGGGGGGAAGPGNGAARGAGATDAGLQGVWTLVAYPDGTNVPAASTSTQLSIDAAGTLVAGDGCNSMSGPVEIGADTFKVGELATTAMACVAVPGHEADPQVIAGQKFTDTIHALLSGTVRWTVSGDRLTLTNGSAHLVYRRVETGGLHDPELLPDTTWRLDTIADADPNGSASSSSDYSAITIRFTAGPNFVVTYLCVTESGGVSTDNGTLRLDVLESRDAKPCSSSANDVDQQVRRRLTGALSWSVVAGQLVINNEQAGSLTFAGVAQSTTTPGPATTS